MRVEPTNDTPWMSSCVQNDSTTSLPPLTRLTTPFGKPAFSMSWKILRCDSGTCSDGFNTKVLPVATAYGRNHSGTIGGKLNGVMAANTPMGWRDDAGSMPAGTPSSDCPFISEGMPHACSPPYP